MRSIGDEMNNHKWTCLCSDCRNMTTIHCRLCSQQIRNFYSVSAHIYSKLRFLLVWVLYWT